MTPGTAQSLSEWAHTARQATEERDRLIVKMRAGGATLREIAEAAGMTGPGVARVLKRRQ